MSTNIDTITKIFKSAQDAEKRGASEEAKAFFQKAAELCNKAGISEAEILNTKSQEERRNEMSIRTITIGEQGTVGLMNSANSIAGILSNMTGGKCNLHHKGIYVNFFGTNEQGDNAEAIAEGILSQMAEALHVARKEFKKNPVLDAYGKKERFSSKGFIVGFLDEMETLAHNVKESRNNFKRDNLPSDEIDESDYTDSHRTAIAIRNMELDIIDFYNTYNTARGSARVNGSSSMGSYKMGVNAAKGANLSGQRALSA